MNRTRSLALVAAAATLTTGVVLADAARSKPAKASVIKKQKRAALAKRIKHAQELRLKDFDTCEAYGAYMRAHAEDIVGPWGLFGGPFIEGDLAAQRAAPAASSAPTAGAPPVAGTDYSTTNNQEADVDEADTVKTDGRTMFAVAAGTLRSVDVRGGGAKALDKLSLGDGGYGSELFLVGDRLLVIGYGSGEVIHPQPPTTTDPAAPATSRAIRPGFYRPATRITLVNVSDPSKMTIEKTMTVDGRWIGARLAGGIVRLVITAQPTGPEFVQPTAFEQADLDAAKAKNVEIVRASKGSDWLPRMAMQDGASGDPRRSDLVGCDDIGFPARFSGMSLLTVLTIDPAKGLAPIDRDAAVTDGETIYASSRALYVATPRWWDPEDQKQNRAPRGVTTALHKFEIDGPTTTYRAAGEVPGFPLSQFAMSEQSGVLRVATTTAPPWWGDGERDETQSYVTTLRETSGALVKVGQVGGLGRGERIYAVRFMGDTGYVVTFRQVDPLYTVDLSNPAAPRVAGELKITGYSAYLHPVGDGLLLGVGQEATPEGRRAGAQVSLFDVSDPARPTRVAQKLLGPAWTNAEWDHHAFLYWPKTGLTMLPIVTEEIDNAKKTYSWTAKAVGLKVGTRSITSAGEIVHPEVTYGPDPITRSVVVGGTVYTLSDHGLGASDLGTLARTGFVSFS